MANQNKKIKGLDGWLLLPIIGLFISIPILLYDLLLTNALYEFDFYIGLLSLLDMVFIVWVVIALFSIFNKKKYVPQMMIAFYMANVIVQLVISFLVDNYEGIVIPIIGGVIWIPYFIYSKRVKNTFVK